MKNNWYSQPEIENALGISRRTFHRRFSGLSSSLTREQTSAGRGRPGKLYHFAADPELSAWHFAQLSRRSTMSGADTIAPDDLALARLRLQAVKQYESIATQLPRVEAVAAVCRHWRLKPMSETVEVTERLPGGHTRKCSKEVSLGEFSPGTLRRWVRSYNKDKNLLDLVPKRKDHAGRSRKDIPEELLNFVHAMSVSTARADVANAIRKARNEWPGDFPEVSEVTWLRRIRERDPERVFDTLGKNGIASFRAKHSPDIERDYSKLRYNQLWQIDDVQEDFYGHGNDPAKILRPYAYAIVRVSTRQWVAAVTSQAPIVQDQVRRILGFAFCSERGGLPEEMSFEGGTVACDDYLAGLLDDLGVKVHRTSMDGGGKAHPNTFADRSVGHPQGKAVIESNIKRHHNSQAFDHFAQAGTDERYSSHANLETIKTEAVRRAKNGQMLILPTPQEWQTKIYAAMERNNNTPHTAMPQIMDPEKGVRHMTPNEYAAHLKVEEVKKMDERLLPLFTQKGLLCKVTKNGFRLNKMTYGRFDHELQKLAGSSVTVHGVSEFPDLAYVVELGRCVERYVAPAWGEEGELIESKRTIERAKRNKYEKLVADALESKENLTVESIKLLSPLPENAECVEVAPAAMLERAGSISDSVAAHREKEQRHEENLSFDRTSHIRRPRKRASLTATARKFSSLVPLSIDNNQQEEETW